MTASPDAHTHTCTHCREVWPCTEPKPLARCKVRVAAQVNRQGPFCTLCQLLISARHVAFLRGQYLRWILVPLLSPAQPYAEVYPKEP